MRQGGTNNKKPTYISTAKEGKHRDVVWQVRWAPDTLEGYLTFFSVSADGMVTQWTLVKTNMTASNILSINFSRTLLNLDKSITDYKVPYIIRQWNNGLVNSYCQDT